MSKILRSGAARAKILAGAKLLSDTVKLTLGPKGRNVIIERKNSAPLITNDGVTIAREVKSADPFENIGVSVLRMASQKTCDKAGDGTTSAVVFAESLLENGYKQIALGASPVLLKQGIAVAADFVEKYIADIAKPCREFDEIRAAAVNSCGSDTDGALVAEAIHRLGASGVVTLEQNHTGETTLKFSDGMEAAIETASPYFIEDPARMETVFSGAKIMIVQNTVKSVKELLPALEYAVANDESLVIIAHDFSDLVVAALVMNRVRRGLRVAAYRALNLGDRCEAVLNDIAALTNATAINETTEGVCAGFGAVGGAGVDLGAGAENGLNGAAVSDFSPVYLGTCDKIICGLKSVKIKASGGAHLENRIKQIRAQIEMSKDEYNTASLTARLGALTNGVAVISVGCATEIEQQERFLRLEDALAAARAAVRGGIVEGGGIAYLRAMKPLAEYIKTLDENLRTGAAAVCESLLSILKQICVNACVPPDIVIDRVRNGALGYNALTDEYTDMFAAAIVDPADVVRFVVINAASVVGTLLTTEGIVVDNDV